MESWKRDEFVLTDEGVSLIADRNFNICAVEFKRAAENITEKE